jgi:hypothetical protein
MFVIFKHIDVIGHVNETQPYSWWYHYPWMYYHLHIMKSHHLVSFIHVAIHLCHWFHSFVIGTQTTMTKNDLLNAHMLSHTTSRGCKNGKIGKKSMNIHFYLISGVWKQ